MSDVENAMEDKMVTEWKTWEQHASNTIYCSNKVLSNAKKTYTHTGMKILFHS